MIAVGITSRFPLFLYMPDVYIGVAFGISPLAHERVPAKVLFVLFIQL